MSNAKAQFEIEKKLFRQSAFYAIMIVLVLWLVKLVESYFEISFVKWGIHPRVWEDLSGILFSPFIHGDLMHLYSNTIPLFVLCTGLLYYYRISALWVLLFIYLMGGTAVWIFARDSWHIGVSGIIYGLIAFIFFSGLFRKEAPAVALSLIVVFLYGSMIWGVLPIQPGVSWEAHLYGALSGIIASVIDRFKNPPKHTNEYNNWEEEYAAGYNEDGDFDYIDEYD